MVDVTMINKNLLILKKNFNKKTIISVLVDGKETVLADLKTDDNFWLEVKYDENYIVVYSRGCMADNIPSSIECVYDIKEKKIINADFETKQKIDNMLLSKKGILLLDIYFILNNTILNPKTKERIDNEISYLTGDNENITHEELVKYILKCYPELSNYYLENNPYPTSDNNKEEFINVRSRLSNELYYFHAMPQKLEIKEKKVKQKKK